MASDLLDLTQLPILDARSLLTRQGIDPKLSDWRTLIGLNDDFFDRMVRDPFYRYAEAIQLAPASEADHHAGPGGLLAHSYDVITLGLKRRRGLQLPHGGSIDQINEQRHLWTYAVFVGGLLHDVGKLMASIRLRVLLKQGTYYNWTPQDKPLREFKDALSYKVEFVKTPYAYHTQVALTLFDFIPTSGRAWLAREPHIMMQLCAFLRGDRFESGVIGEILEAADMTSTAQSQKRPVQQRFSKTPSTIERMVHWVRNWIVEGDIKINKNGAMGWVDADGHLFMVCRSLADKIIHHCDAMGITDIPRDPIRLYDIFQDYGFALPTPEGKAIWNMLIECDDYKHALTCLKFEARRFTVPTRPMAAFEGMITVYGKQRPAASHTQAAKLTKGEDSAVKLEQQIRDTLDRLGGDRANTQEPEHQETAVNEEAVPSHKVKEFKQVHKAEQLQESSEQIGGASSISEEAGVPADSGNVAFTQEDEMPWGEPDESFFPDHEAATDHEAAKIQETATFHETDFAQEAAPSCEIIQEAGASAVANEAIDFEEEPVFSDRVKTDEPVFTDRMEGDTTSTVPASVAAESFIERYQADKKPLASAVATVETTVDSPEAPAQAHKKFSRYTISGLPAYEPGMVTLDAQDLGRMFLNWLRINMLNKTIQMNCTEALVHTMEDCVLLLAPGIFKNFLQVHGVGKPDDIEINHKKLAEKFRRLKVNIKTSTEPSINIHKVYVVGKNRATSIHGWKIPLNLIYSDEAAIPKPNKYLSNTPDI